MDAVKNEAVPAELDELVGAPELDGEIELESADTSFTFTEARPT